MTRKEEIEQAAMQIGGVHPDWSALECFQIGYKEGAKWADKTMIEKAKAWVKNCFIGPLGEGLANNIANEFAKYLEE